MPIPTSVALTVSVAALSTERRTVYSANPETTTAISSESSVIGRSNAIGMGSSNASMPMKCMDQMPAPMAKAPQTSQYQERFSLADATRPARSSAVYDAMIATTMERVTSAGL